MLFTFEGIDGCGKSTQIKLLAEYLITTGKKVLTLREPGGTELAEKIRNLLLNKSNHVSPLTELLLFEASRSDLVENVIKPALSNNDYVLIDRFYDSTLAYQGYGRGIQIEKIKFCQEIATNDIKPDLTFFLDIPLEISVARCKDKNLDRMELAGNIFFDKVSQGFREIAKKEPDRIISIDGTLSEDAIFSVIKNKVNSLK